MSGSETCGSGNLLQDPNAGILREDVTARKQAEDSLRASEERLNLALSAGRLATWDLHLPTSEIVWNDEQFRILGYEIGEVVPSYEAWAERLHPEDRERAEAIFAQAMKDCADYHAEFRSLWPDGTVRWMEGRGMFHGNAQGQATRSFGVMMDITERKEADEALRESEERMTAVMENLTEAIMVAQVEGPVFYWNSAALAIFGYASMEECRRKLADFAETFEVRDLDDDRVLPVADWPMSRVMRGEVLRDWEVRLRRLDQGGEKILAYSGWLIRGAHGETLAFVSTSDITERKRVEQALQESEDRLRLALSGAKAAAWQWVVPTGELIWSPECYALYGRDPVRDLPQYEIWRECLHPDDLEPTERIIREIIQQKKPDYRTEYRVVLPNNDIRWLAALGKMDYGADGTPLRMSGINVDITETKRAEQERRTLQAYSASGWALVRATDEESFLREFCRIVVEDCGHAMVWVGYKEDDAKKSVRPVAYAGYEDGYLKALRLTWGDSEHGRGPAGTAIRTGQVAICADMRTDPNFRLWREEALSRGYAASLSLPLKADNKTFGAITIYARMPHSFSVSDMSLLQKLADELSYGLGVLRLRGEHARQEAALRSSEGRYRALVEQAPGGIFVADARGAYVDVNSVGCAMLGYSREELVRLTIADVIDPREIARIGPEVAHFAGGAMVVSEWRFRRKDGSFFTGEVRVKQLADGRLQAFVLDISERKAAELAQREADNRKDEFLAMLAHELRNPLTPIRNAAHILGRLQVDEPRVQWAQGIIERQVAHLTRLVDELLDISRIARGKVTLKKARVELAELVRQACEAVQPLMVAKGHHFEAILPQTQVTLDGDIVRLVQVLQNLLDNAAKFTPEGGRIQLAARMSGAEVEMEVRDNGRGISADLLPEVFALFRQGERTLERSQGGLGIGLTLVRQLLELHGGKVEAHSAGPDLGASFIVRLPIANNMPKEIEFPSDIPPKQALRVLVVDDDPAVTESTVILLVLDGHQVRSANSVEAALIEVEAFRPQAILLDIGLPGKDGYEVARLIRGLPGAAAIQLVAVSGYGNDEAKARSREAGFNLHLVKPVDPERLSALLAELARPVS